MKSPFHNKPVRPERSDSGNFRSVWHTPPPLDAGFDGTTV
jgi:hypothetical protein